MPSDSFYEIELKALLSKEQYDRLYSELPQKMSLINEETITTVRYRPGDVRLRSSDKTLELVCKTGDPTKICREESKVPLSKAQYDLFSKTFVLMGKVADPPWTKDKREFQYIVDGFDYVVCLQHIHNFAYILEVEFLSKTDTSEIHEPILKKIISALGCEPIKPADFSNMIKKYIENNKK